MKNNINVLIFRTMNFLILTFKDSSIRYFLNATNHSIYINYCNANCSFCVAQLRFENQGQLYKKGRIQSDQEYFKRLSQILEYLRPLNSSISITGGEPTKSRRLIPILELIEKFGYRKRTLTTNGSGLFDKEVNGKTVLQIKDVWTEWGVCSSGGKYFGRDLIKRAQDEK